MEDETLRDRLPEEAPPGAERVDERSVGAGLPTGERGARLDKTEALFAAFVGFGCYALTWAFAVVSGVLVALASDGDDSSPSSSQSAFGTLSAIGTQLVAMSFYGGLGVPLALAVSFVLVAGSSWLALHDL